jgi:type II secretory pathway predicted ATPase ExeA
MQKLVMAINNAGQHAVVYGEPGVGKTSLGKIMVKALDRTETIVSIYVSCTQNDDFGSICKKAFAKVQINSTSSAVGFQAKPQRESVPLAELLPTTRDLSQEDVAEVLARLTDGGSRVVLFVDEFDRARSRARRPFAELVKSLSDNGHPVTIVFIGVAENVEQLIEAHRSTERNLLQVRMPRMSTDELSEIVRLGLKTLSMEIDPIALQRIAVLSRCLPHFTHLVTQHAAVNSVMNGRDIVTVDDVELGVKNAVEHSQHSLVQTYRHAVNSRSDSYRDVLLGCALAETDDHGWVTPAEVRAQLVQLTLPSGMNVNRYLQNLCVEDRGKILCETGPSRRHKYRFANPLMQPYVAMVGVVNGVPVERVATAS